MLRHAGLVLAAVAGLCATACGGATPTTLTPTTAPPTATAVGASDLDNGRTVALHVGDRLTVALHSTYWTFGGSSAPSVLVQDGPAGVAPSPSGCVPGEGCGTVTMRFDARTVGTAEIDASRTTCGEALLCTGSAGHFSLLVHVGAS